MKKLLLAIIALSGAMFSMAQDTTAKEKIDTIRVGGMIIIKKKGEDGKEHKEVVMSNRRRKNNSNVSTNWWIFDIGFANLNDKTNYSSAAAMAFAPGGSKDGMNLKTKSMNVNVWFFMQRLNVIKHVVNLKYGMGLELNNYNFEDDHIRLTKNPTNIIFTGPSAEKNKLAVDYLTVPLLLNFNLTPGRNKGFGFSAGVSGGYRYDAREKTKINGKKDKVHDDFDLRKWKVSYIGELNLGPIKLYGSYAMKSMWEKGLDQVPYNVGVRLSNW